MDVFEIDSTRFWAKVEKTDTCWNWTATKTRGYGMIRAKVNGMNRMVLAHRLSFAMEYGSVKSDKHIDHMCHHVLGPPGWGLCGLLREVFHRFSSVVRVLCVLRLSGCSGRVLRLCRQFGRQCGRGRMMRLDGLATRMMHS